jgi:FtsX-like permease family
VLVELYGTLGDARDLLAIVALLTQALVVAAVMLAVLAGQAQHRRLFGVLRALGASRAYVFAAVWLHAMCIVAAGGLVGLALGLAGCDDRLSCRPRSYRAGRDHRSVHAGDPSRRRAHPRRRGGRGGAGVARASAARLLAAPRLIARRAYAGGEQR